MIWCPIHLFEIIAGKSINWPRLALWPSLSKAALILKDSLKESNADACLEAARGWDP